MIRHSLSNLVCCLAALAGTIPAHAVAPSAVEQEITRLEKDSNDSYAANNLPKYFGYYADDAVLIFYNERTTLAAYRKMWTESVKTEPIDSVKLSDMVVRVMPAADTAIASYQILVRTRHPDGKVTDEHAFETDVWVKQAAGWKLGHVHYSVTPAK
jgi:ketosteroid isomerase-like protein